jgi:putative ABC transport system ATP-binding protein
VGRNGGIPDRELRERIKRLALDFDLEAHTHKKPSHVSGGQRQRAGVARAMINEPSIILADEPTAALDWAHGKEVVELLIRQTRMKGAALLVVSHDSRLIDMFNRTCFLQDGKLTES